MIKQTRIGVLISACSLLLLSACGQKGPLYLPKEEQKQQTNQPKAKETASTNVEEKKDGK